MKKIIIVLSVLSLVKLSNAQTIEKFSIDSGGASATAAGIEILYTIGEVVVQEFSSASISVSEGFINPTALEIKIDPKIFLQGPYSTGVLNDGLRTSANLPTTSPYIDGLTCDESIFATTGSDAIVDWVWIEIRAVDMTTVIQSMSALIQSDGDVVSVNGLSSIVVDVPDGNYYFMISHRNHLGVITSNQINLTKGNTTILDLTISNALILGGSNGIADMGDGNFALFSGDFNGDGQIQNSDKIAVQSVLGTNGFLNADIDMNSQVQNIDIQNKLTPNIGKGQQFSKNVSSLKLFAKTKKNK